MNTRSSLTLIAAALLATQAANAQSLATAPAPETSVRTPRVIDLGAAGEAPDADADGRAVLRWRAMTINAATFRGMAEGDQIRFNLFDDTVLTGVVEQLDARSPERFVWQGQVLDGDAHRFLLSVWDDAVHVDIQGPGATTYVVRGVPQRPDLRGVFIVRQLDTFKIGRCGGALAAPEHEHAQNHGPEDQEPLGPQNPATNAQGPAGTPASSPVGQADADGPGAHFIVTTPTTSDVAVYWTQQAQNGAGGLGSLFAAINGAVADTNATMAASMTNGRNPARIQWVAGNLIPNYTESGNELTELSRFSNEYDGTFDFVHAERDTYGIDLMVMIGEFATPQVCGRGYVPSSASVNNEWRAFSYTKRECLGGLNISTFAHELGHNFGLAHDRENAGAASPAFSYGYGYRWFGILYRDTMAYEPGIRQQIYSNPNLYIGGVQGDTNFRAGVPIGQPGEADASTAMSNMNPFVTAYRARPSRTYLQYTGQAAGAGVPVDVFRTLGHAQSNQPTGWSLWINGVSRVNENLLLNRPMLLERWPDTGTVIIGRP